MGRKQLFVSHVSIETELAQSLKKRLESDFLGMLDIFVSSDHETIRAGRKWLDEVEKGLKAADLQVILCSEKSVGRPWVNFEAGAVWLRGIPVIPICHSGLNPEQLPVPLKLLEGIDLTAGGLRKLYDAVAAVLEVSTPKVDFAALARELKTIERKLMEAPSAEVITDPRILVAASAHYVQLEFERDVDVVEKAFPECCTVDRALTSKRLRELLLGEHFDIVHLVIAVDPTNGDLIFHAPKENADRMPAQAFAAVLRESKVSLVVLATCNALLLAVDVGHVANMAASDEEISGEQAESWADCFYGLLASGVPLYKTFELTRLQSSVPIRPIRHHDIAFARTDS